MESFKFFSENYFYDFVGNPGKLTQLLREIGINENASECYFEYSISERTEVDFAIKLENGKHVYFEIKYTEPEFGKAIYSKTDYSKRLSEIYDNITDLDTFKNNYQFIRNIILAVDGNYTVFLVPKANESICDEYERCCGSIPKINGYNIKLLYWEDLLEKLPNDKVKEKYFIYNTTV